MTDYFTKTTTPVLYFEKPGTAAKTDSMIRSTASDPTTQLKDDLSKAENAYEKVTSEVVTKRYAVKPG